MSTGYNFFLRKSKKTIRPSHMRQHWEAQGSKNFNESGVFINIERFLYVPANNSLRVMVYRSNEQYIATHIYPLDFTKTPPKSSIKRAYNESGDYYS